MSKIIVKAVVFAGSIAGAVFTIIPESVFGVFCFAEQFSSMIRKLWISCPMTDLELRGLFGKIEFVAFVFLACLLGYSAYIKKRSKIFIKGRNYYIQVKYGDIFKEKGWKVINFDECFTIKVGNGKGDIKASSVCGKYLDRYPIENMQSLIDEAELKPSRKKSLYKNKTKYESGLIIPRDNYFLMSFAKLDSEGLGFFDSREEYYKCLSTLWKELDARYENKDVCISVLGSGLTRIGDETPTRQELVDMIIYSYKLSRRKIKTTLKIICLKGDDFSLDRVGKAI